MTVEELALPSHIEAEQSVLGAVMLGGDVMTDIAEIIKPVDFYRPAHQLIFEAMVDMYREGHPIDAVTMFDVLGKRKTINQAGGGSYLHQLIAEVPTAANAAYYAAIVQEKALLRGLVMAGHRITALGYDVDDADALLERAESEIFALSESRTKEDYVALADVLPGAMDTLEAVGKQGYGSGLLTGFKDLDALTHGLLPGQLVVVGARPAIGKSTLGLDFARNATKLNETAVVFSLEMSREEIVNRLLAAESRVGFHRMRSGMMTEDDWTRIAKRLEVIGNMPLFIDDSPNMSMMEIRAKCKRIKQQHGLRLVVVDYLQLMQGDRPESRQQEISDISRALKLLAKELEVTVVAMSQLNRGPEQRTEKTPKLSDLRESGAIEQDADMVILLHREDAQQKEHPRAGEADLIVAKHRNGPTAIVTVAFQGHYCRFIDMAPN